MVRRMTIGLLTLSAAGLFVFLTPVGTAVSQSIEEVFVTNWPRLQNIEGEVEVVGPVRLSKMVTIEEIVVPPVDRDETTRLVQAGTLVTDGFPNVVLSLHGVVRGDVKQPGSVGVILLPDEEDIQIAFNEMGLLHFSLEAVASGVSSRTPYFASAQPKYTIGFGSYRVMLYNTTDKTVTANLYAYLTN